MNDSPADTDVLFPLPIKMDAGHEDQGNSHATSGDVHGHYTNGHLLLMGNDNRTGHGMHGAGDMSDDVMMAMMDPSNHPAPAEEEIEEGDVLMPLQVEPTTVDEPLAQSHLQPQTQTQTQSQSHSHDLHSHLNNHQGIHTSSPFPGDDVQMKSQQMGWTTTPPINTSASNSITTGHSIPANVVNHSVQINAEQPLSHISSSHYAERHKQSEGNVSSGQEAEEELEEGTVLADTRIKDAPQNGERDVEMTENQGNLNSNTNTTTTNMIMRENIENDGVNRDLNADTAEDGQVDISRLSEWTTNDLITYLSSRCAKFGHLYIDICKEKKLTGAMLQQMSDERLQNELNMTNPLHRQRILRDTMDSRRTIEQIQQIHEQTTQDGGTVTSRFLRLTAADVYAFLLALQGKQLDMDLKDIVVPLMHLQLNGEQFMNLNESYLREQVKIQMPQIIKVLTLVSWIQSGYDYDSLKQVLKEKEDKLKEKEREKEKEKDKDKDKKNKRSSSKTNPNVSDDDTLDRLEVLALIEHIWYKERKSPPTEPCYHLLPQHLFDVRKTRGAVVVPKGPNKPVLEWDNNDCLQWLETIKASDKLMRSFRETKVTGKDILNITQWSLENVFGISHKSHIKAIVQGVDKLRDQLMKDTLLKASHVQEYLNRTPRRPRKKSKDVDASAPRGESVANNATDNGPRKPKPRKKSVKSADQQEDTQVPTQPINLPSTPHQSTAPQQPTTSQPQQLIQQQQQQQQQMMQATQPIQGTPQSIPPAQPTPTNSMSTYPNYGYHGYHAPNTQSQYPYYSGPQPYSAMNMSPAYGQPNGNANGTKSELAQIAPLCSCCGKSGEVMRCSQCKQAFYCSRECQLSDWKKHQKTCRPLAKKRTTPMGL